MALTKNFEYSIFSFADGTSAATRKLYRKLYGYNLHGRHYKGLLEKYGGVKLGSGSIIVPSSCAAEVKRLLTSSKFEFKQYKVYRKSKLT